MSPIDMQAKAAGFTLTRHLKEQAKTKGVSLLNILEVLKQPSITYANGMAEDQERFIGNGIVVVVDVLSGHAITVYENVRETDVRPDQIKSGSVKNRSKFSR